MEMYIWFCSQCTCQLHGDCVFEQGQEHSVVVGWGSCKLMLRDKAEHEQSCWAGLRNQHIREAPLEVEGDPMVKSSAIGTAQMGTENAHLVTI